MIRLNVEEYCHTCDNFSPVYEKPTVGYAVDSSSEVYRSDGVIICEHRKLCSNIYRYIARKAKEEEKND